MKLKCEDCGNTEVFNAFREAWLDCRVDGNGELIEDSTNYDSFNTEPVNPESAYCAMCRSTNVFNVEEVA